MKVVPGFENHPIYHIAVDNRVYALNYPRGCIISSAHVHLIRSTMMDKALLRRNDDPPFPNNPRHRLEAGISSTLFIPHRSDPVSLITTSILESEGLRQKLSSLSTRCQRRMSESWPIEAAEKNPPSMDCSPSMLKCSRSWHTSSTF